MSQQNLLFVVISIFSGGGELDREPLTGSHQSLVTGSGELRCGVMVPGLVPLPLVYQVPYHLLTRLCEAPFGVNPPEPEL